MSATPHQHPTPGEAAIEGTCERPFSFDRVDVDRPFTINDSRDKGISYRTRHCPELLILTPDFAQLGHRPIAMAQLDLFDIGKVDRFS